MSTLFYTPDLCLEQTPRRDPNCTWVVTIRRNGMRFPNFTGSHAHAVLDVASTYLGESRLDLSVQKQIDWDD